MELFIALTPFICGIIWVLFAGLFETKNFKSKIIFEFIPFITGMCSIFVGCKLMGWIL